MKIDEGIQFIYQIKIFENHMELLLLGNEGTFHDNKSHYVYINSSNRFIYNKTKHKNKKHFCMNSFECFSSE